MRTIPAAVKTLIKSKLMIGENAPKVEVNILTGSGGISEPPSWQSNNIVRHEAAASSTCPSFATGTDGYIHAVWFNFGDYKIKYAKLTDVSELYDTDNCLDSPEGDFTASGDANAASIDSGSDYDTNSLITRAQIKRIDNYLLMVKYDPGDHNTALNIRCYKSALGDGSDWEYISEIETIASPSKISTYNDNQSNIGPITILNSGRIAFIAGRGRTVLTNYWSFYPSFYYSDDDGENWSRVGIDWGSYAYAYAEGLGKGIGVFSNCIICLDQTSSRYNYYQKFMYSEDEGATWSSCDLFTPAVGDNAQAIPANIFSPGDGYAYMFHSNENSPGNGESYVYRLPETTVFPLTGQNPYTRGVGNTWGDKWISSEFSSTSRSMVIMPDSETYPWWLFCWMDYDGRYNSNVIVGTRTYIPGTAKILPTSISVSRELASIAQSASVQLPNVLKSDMSKVGKYSPESGVDANWNNILLPGAEIEIIAGYGVNEVDIFNGNIDDVEVSRSSVEANISLESRDNGAYLLDEIIVDGSNNYITYSSKTVEYIINDLLTKAGFTTITTEATGITITSVTFDRVTYGEAIEQLTTISGYELCINEDNEASFIKPNDRQPENEDDTIVLNGTTAEDLAEFPIVTATIVVYSGVGKTGTLYSSSTDYLITEGTHSSAWSIERRAGSTIPDGGTVYVSYVYSAWVFHEGQDLIDIKYRYSRRDIYGEIVVTGEDSSGEPVTDSYNLGTPSNYGVSANKKLFVDDTILDTSAKCLSCANQLGAEMIKKFREVNVVVIAVPWLQIGDCISIVERSTGISEVYRILSMSIGGDVNGLFMNLRCYHYGYSP